MFEQYLQAIAELHGAEEIGFSVEALSALTPHLSDVDREGILSKVEDWRNREITLEVPPVLIASHHHKVLLTKGNIRYGQHCSEWSSNAATTFSRQHWEQNLFTQFSLPHLLKVELVNPYSPQRDQPLRVGYLVLRESLMNIEFNARAEESYFRTELGNHIKRELLTSVEILELESLLPAGEAGQQFCVTCGFNPHHCSCIGLGVGIPKAQRIGLPLPVLNRWRAPLLDADGYLLTAVH